MGGGVMQELGEKKLSRRNFLSIAGKLAIGVPLGTSILGLRSNAFGFGWDALTYPEGMDPRTVADIAYAGYSGYGGMKGCAYGVFDAIVGQMKLLSGDGVFDGIPTEMSGYGKGGIVGWGHLCGALNGAYAAINLVVEDFNDITNVISEVMCWYSQEALPVHEPDNPSHSTAYIPRTVADSGLCHASVTNWCRQSGFTVNSPERSERCARLAADVAAKAVELLNSFYDPAEPGIERQYFESPVVEECGTCHGKQAMDDVNTTMDCLGCHDKHGSGQMNGNRHMNNR
jgi:hypothetical protein